MSLMRLDVFDEDQSWGEGGEEAAILAPALCIMRTAPPEPIEGPPERRPIKHP